MAAGRFPVRLPGASPTLSQSQLERGPRPGFPPVLAEGWLSPPSVLLSRRETAIEPRFK